ncbi:MAG: SPOR domain-containing protein [Spirochaetes bacterium]|nr:SPOR domain-containing protein [Spirochaetota bacterium]
MIGIKFSGGTQREIMDKKTFNAVTDISKKLSIFSEEKKAEPASRENPFPKNTYPYVIRVNDEHDYAMSQKIAGLLSERGHTVILSKNNGRYRIYIGPYKSETDAREALEKISDYKKYSLAEKTRIIKR